MNKTAIYDAALALWGYDRQILQKEERMTGACK